MDEYKYLIPEESEDAASIDAKTLRKVENDMRKVFESYEYEELLLPTFEYLDLYETLEKRTASPFSFVGQEGKRLTLRTDFTLPIARLYTKEGGIKRYSYFGKVYRNQARHKGRSSELYQGGIELIGLDEKQGDNEILTVLEKSLPKLKHIKIEFGHALFYKRIVELVNDDSINHILEKKSFSQMRSFLTTSQVDTWIKELLLELLQTLGTYEDMLKLRDIIQDDILLQALDTCLNLYKQSHMRESISFDLLMVPHQAYYTGIMFRIYSTYSPYAILSGGRYDKLMTLFNKSVPAIGFSYHFNSLIEALKGETND